LETDYEPEGFRKVLRDLVCLYSLLTQMVALKGSKNVSGSLTWGVLGRGDLHAALVLVDQPAEARPTILHSEGMSRNQ